VLREYKLELQGSLVAHACNPSYILADIRKIVVQSHLRQIV
jgi:hypothetical protein